MKLIFLFLLSSLVLIRCKPSEKVEVKGDFLVAKWMITDAIRNGKITSTLKDGYLQFDNNGIMKTNIMGEELTSSYSVNNRELSFDGNFPYNFTIEKLTKDSLQLSGEMRKFDMVFFMINENILKDSLHHEQEHLNEEKVEL